MNTIEQCPWCDEPLAEPVDAAIEDAESFCPRCSAPLFWAPSQRTHRPAAGAPAVAVATQHDPAADPSRRWPELRGVRSDASVPCWQCLEPNQQIASTCHRCGARIPMPAAETKELSRSVPMCGTASGVNARRRIEVKAWILVVLGIALLALTVRLIATAW